MTRFAGILLLALALLLCARPLAAAETAQDAFARGNALYGAGQYAEAQAAYQSAERAGLVSANLYYNLGNAAYRQGQNGAAVLNYQRALILDPGHAEAAANLAFVRGASPAAAEGSSIEQAVAARGTNFWCLLAAAAAWVAVAAVAATYFSRPWRIACAVTMAAVAAASVAAVWFLVSGPENPARAIVLTDHTRAYYAPAENAKLVSTLSSGSSVRILSRQGPWTYAQLADGARAWLASASVEKVIPAPY